MHHERVSGDPVGPVPRTIAIVGCGHVGLVMAAGFAHLGHRVIGLDSDPDLVEGLRRGLLRVQEQGLPPLIAEGVASGRLSFTVSYDEAVPEAEFIFLAVDTPPAPGGAADLRNLRSAATSVAASLNGMGPIVVNKSTAPIGTGDQLESLLWRTVRDGVARPRIVSNPEFLRQGRAVRDFFEPDRIVVGAPSVDDARAVAALYRGLGGELIITTRRTAEMIKYVANSFLAARVSFINEIAQLCDAMGVDIDDVVAGVSQDERIGAHFFKPGIGYGGSCLPKDTAALRFMGEASGVATPFLAAVQQVNQAQRMLGIRQLRAALGSLDGKRIAVWGLTFKGETEDIRESPAMDVVSHLVNDGADVIAYDPSQPRRLPERLHLTLAESAMEAVVDADALAILSDWPEFGAVPLQDVRRRMRGDVLFDGRNVLAPGEAHRHGFHSISVGRGRSLDVEAVAR